MADNISNIEIDIDDFSGVDSNNVLTSAPSQVFSRADDHSAVFDSFTKAITTPTESADPIGEPSVETPSDETLDSLNSLVEQINSLAPGETIEDSEVKVKADKSSLIEYLKGKIEASEFSTFDDYNDEDSLDDYLSKLPKKELHALIDENLKLKEDKIKQEAPSKLFEELPYELQVAADYWINKGGRDLKTLFTALGKVEQVRELNLEEESGQEQVVHEYLMNTNTDLSPDEITEQIEEWKELGYLEKKATMFKPKLEKLREHQVANQLKIQEQKELEKRAAAETYVKNVYEALKPGELTGLKLDQKTQASLYDGLVRANYDSIQGGKTNLLGHLLEKFQYKDQDYKKIAKVLWLLKDEEGYENALIQKGKNIKTEEVSKKLKTEQSNKSGSVSIEAGTNTSRVKTSIPKPSKNIFGR